jgi:tetratricopeptide (TPR) repeat protein
VNRVRWYAAALVALAAGLSTASAPAPPQTADPCAPPSAAVLAALPPATPGPELTEQALHDAVRNTEASAARARRPDELATALAIRAALYNQLGRPEKAVDPAAEAVRLLGRARAERRADPRLEPIARAILGETLQLRGHAAEALAQYDSALAVAPPAFVAERGRLCNDRGLALLDLGDVDSAAHYLERALAIRRLAGDREGEAVVLNNQARVLQTIGRADPALVVLRRALEVRRGVPNPAAAAVLHNNVGYAFDLLGLPDSALAAYSDALSVLGGRHPSYTGLTLINRGRAQLARGRLDEARRDLDSARVLKRQAGDAAGEAWVLHDLGRVHLARGELDAAAAQLDSARAAMHALGDRVREGDALYFLGVVHHARGGPDAWRRAAADYARAAAVRASVARTAVRDEDRVVLAEQDVALTARWVLAWAALQHAGAPGAAGEALAAAERGRARALLDLMARAGPGGVRGPTDAPDAATVLRPLRDERTPALSYLVTDSALVTWLALPDGRLIMDCARVPRATLNTLVGALRRYLLTEPVDSGAHVARRATMLTATTPAPTVGCRDVPAPADADTSSRARVTAALGRVLLPPSLAAALPPGGDLVVVPHGVLALVPFAILPAGPTGRSAAVPLGVRFALRYAPSFTVLAALASHPGPGIGRAEVQGRAVLVVGNPVMPSDPDGQREFDRLPSAGATAVWLAGQLGAQALTDAGATKAAVLARLSTSTLVHFGTHGRAYAGEARTRQSFVALSPTPGDSGMLRVADVLAAPPLAADLVTLIACQTGLGDLTDAEGTIGFQRALLARGRAQHARQSVAGARGRDGLAGATLLPALARRAADEGGGAAARAGGGSRRPDRQGAR